MGDAASVCGHVAELIGNDRPDEQCGGRLSTTVARLAAPTPGEYDRVRRDEAAKLGWRYSTRLDAADGEGPAAR